MVFKNFRIQIVLRVLLLTAASAVTGWCLLHGFYLRSVYTVAAIVIMIVELIVYVDRFNRDVRIFMLGLLHRDFTNYYKTARKGQSFDALYETLNDISGVFKKLSAEKEVQHRTLELLLEHVRVGILSIDGNGTIHLANQAARNLLQRPILTSLDALASLDDVLVRTLREIRTGEVKLVKLRVSNEPLQLSIHASEIMLEDRYYKLISMQNIRSELDAREMEAWQRLIRVLSHEIMNSVAPVTSLSGTLHGLVKQNGMAMIRDEALYHALDKGLEAINIRSEGLYHFTQSYRKLTGIPTASMKPTNLEALVHRVQLLLHQRIDERGIHVTITGTSLEVQADPELMEHVLINLMLNAIEAVAACEHPQIHIRIAQHPKGNWCLHIADNGEGMDDVTAEKIFIPFFTTRKNGSGIGLAITKQILQLHGADIQFVTERGKGTEFVIILPL